ncbi:MAG: hypothetical protein R2849_18770 [Thermomicrobiales bacterium]
MGADLDHRPVGPRQRHGYVAATRYKLDDLTPYLLKTTDYGQNWQLITNGIPEDDFTRTIREDPEPQRASSTPGTETALYISFDDGENWDRFQLNLPVCPIHDIIIKDKDLIAATHSAASWILDDLSPLYQIDDEVTSADMARLLQARYGSSPKKLGRLGQNVGEGKEIYGRIGIDNGDYPARTSRATPRSRAARRARQEPRPTAPSSTTTSRRPR